MRKNVFGRRLKRDANERKALFKSLLTALVLQERIKTTEPKAKAVKGQADKLVTIAKRDTTAHYALLSPYLTSIAIQKILTEIAPRFAGRQGGYTRIIRFGKRKSDSASMVYLEWVERNVAQAQNSELKKAKKGTKGRENKKEEITQAQALNTKAKQKKELSQGKTEKKPRKNVKKKAEK